MTSYIILGIIALTSLITYIVYAIIKNKIYSTSHKIVQLQILQSKLKLKIDYNHSLKISHSEFKTKRQYDNYNINNDISNNSFIMTMLIKKRHAYNQQFNDYTKLCDQIFKSVITPMCAIKQSRFNTIRYLKLEKYFFDKLKRKIKIDNTPITLTVHLSYTSPAGRNHYSRNVTINENEFSIKSWDNIEIDYKIPENKFKIHLINNTDKYIKINNDVNVINHLEEIESNIELSKTFEIDNIKYEIIDENKVKIIDAKKLNGDISLLSSINHNNTEYLITILGKNAFRDNKGLTSISIPSTIIEIEKNCFTGCSSIIEVTLPNSIKKIQEEAFSFCSKLKSIYIPKNVIYIGNNCFWFNASLIIYMEIMENILKYEKDWNSEGLPVKIWIK